ncbi:gamma-glutamylcyclotransferase [Paenibacillus sp. IB182496]|uniref:Gamma-glutamylcyclotransferase n=1 Tax=Paenibacillus sabuli TaxID=2772509 RepID=A0A927BX27_9BACL|nr:gamma-glutamylcyclotransferase family protein [Paenibacillus sabuli]MBD2848457.1 gamma-glutamylcyclotransferase [Paenibacillus sabuli]
MKQSEQRVFVYGSLLPGMANRHVVVPYLAREQPGTVRGRLVDAGPYPALVRACEAGSALADLNQGDVTAMHQHQAAHTAERRTDKLGSTAKAGGKPQRTREVEGSWIDIASAGLRVLDELEEFYGIEEEGDYMRIWVRDACETSLCGWTYVWPSARGCPYIAGGRWLEHLQAR